MKACSSPHFLSAFSTDNNSTNKRFFYTIMKQLLLLFFVVFVAATVNGIEHNLPPGVELVDPKSLGLDSQFDLDKLLGNVKLLPNSGKIDPKTGTKTQILTVGFEGDENINLDDFELPSSNGGIGNNTELVSSAFESFRDYIKSGKPIVNPSPSSYISNAAGSQPSLINAPAQPAEHRKNVVMRRRKIVKTTTTTQSPPAPPPSKNGPKVVELDSSQIEKLLATGKLKSKKVGDSQVIEITQDQLNELYAMENGGEFKQLLTQGEPTTQDLQYNTPQQQTAPPAPLQTTQVYTTTTPSAPPSTTTSTTTESTGTTVPPIIYQFNTKDFDKPGFNNQYVTKTYRQPTQQYFPQQQQQQQQQYVQQQQQHKVLKTPTYEFISVPPSSFSSSSNANNKPFNQQTYYTSSNTPVGVFQQDPLPIRRPPPPNHRQHQQYSQQQQKSQVIFPSASSSNIGDGSRFHRDIALNTFYNGDGLNYKIAVMKINNNDQLWGV